MGFDVLLLVPVTLLAAGLLLLALRQGAALENMRLALEQALAGQRGDGDAVRVAVQRATADMAERLEGSRLQRPPYVGVSRSPSGESAGVAAGRIDRSAAVRRCRRSLCDGVAWLARRLAAADRTGCCRHRVLRPQLRGTTGSNDAGLHPRWRDR